MTGALAIVGIIGASRRRLSAETQAIIENARYMARRDTRIHETLEHIMRRLREEGWNDLTIVVEADLILYTIVAHRYHQVGGKLRCSRQIGRAMLLDRGGDYAEYLVWFFEREWERAVGKL